MSFPWNRMEAEMKRELAHHLHELRAEYERRGYSPADAARMAKREFGGSEQVAERCRDERRGAWLAGVGQDITFALRQMRRSPGFALTAVIILALGIAANVVVFGVLQGLVLRPLDLPHAERLMTLARADLTYPVFSYPEVRDVQAHTSTAFSAVAAWGIENFGLEANGVTRPVWGFEVGGEYFDAVGVKPFLGRLLQRSDDERAGASQAAVLAWPLWKSQFGGDRAVVGKTVRINKHPYTVVGITPERFYGTEKFVQPSIFLPLASAAAREPVSLQSRSLRDLFAIVRLRAAATMPQVQTELSAIGSRANRLYPREEEKLAYKLTSPGLMGDFLGAPARAFLAAVMGLAAIVLLAACANLGGLFAARTTDRTREIAIRLAIGSSRWRVIRQVLVEAFLISLVGGACASVLAWLALTGLAAWRPPTEYPLYFVAVTPQPSLIVTAFLISTLAGVLFGVMPLRQIFQTDPNDAIKSGGNQSFAGRRWAVRDLLLAAQIALCCVTVTAAFVSLRGLGKALTMDIGFQPRHAVIAKFELSQAGYTKEGAEQFQRRLLAKVSGLPGVARASYADSTPLSKDTNMAGVFSQETTDFRPSNRALTSYNHNVAAGYFAAAGTPLLAGRDISFSDTSTSPPVAVVNQFLARRLFHSDAAVGRFFKDGSGIPIRIIGVVPDGKYLTVSEDQAGAAFFPILQRPGTKTSFIVRLRDDAPEAAVNEMAATVRKAIRELDPSVPIRESSAWNDQLGLTFFLSRVATAALGIFGAFGLLLSVAGTFGLASYTVSKRLRELSIRVALGAQAEQIVWAALGRMLILLVGGSVAGITLGAAASRLLSAIVYEASAQDPFVLGAVALTMVLTGSLAVAAPVRRALRVHPAVLLREQ